MGTSKIKNLSTSVEMRRKAEDLLEVKTAKLTLPRTHNDTQRLVHELEVHQIELEMQNAELHRVNEELRLANEQTLHLASFPQLNPNPILEVDTTGNVTYSNPATQSILKMLGIAKENVSVFVPPDLIDIFREWDRKDNLSFNSELIINDRHFLNVIYFSPQSDFARIYARDITECKQTELALLQSEEQFRTLADGIPHLCWMANTDGWIFWYNQRWYEFTGTTPEQMEGWGWQSVHDPERLPQVLEQWKVSISSGDAFEMVFPLRSSDGVFRTFLTRVIPVCDRDGKVIRWFGTNTDISEQKRMQEALEEINRTLEVSIIKAVDEMRLKDQVMIQQNSLAGMGEMINNISHQWRQPLNVISLVIQSVQLRYGSGTSTSEEMNSDIQNVMENIMHMSQTIEDFRNFLKQDKVKQEFFISDAVNHALSLVSASLEYHNFKVEIKTKDNATVMGYQNEYSQVLLNIISNTCDACVEHSVSNPRILICIAQENEHSVLYIRDNCGGIPDDIKSKIFDPYFTTHGPDKGTGIGLYMSKMIIEQNMNGQLTACNIDGGVEFRIEI